jgi:NAD(P)-dependent dehydrogenase (short-subunit alcohol dehydrogenase family)
VGKSVVITGANSGIGLATAVELARAGYDVIGTARSQEKADVLHAAAGERDVEVRSVILDVADEASTRQGFDRIDVLTGGGPWAVINNAGFAQAGAVEDVSAEDARYQLEVNIVAPARIAQLVLPGMRERGDGRIVNISSIAGRVSSPLTGWYCASKHGLEALSDSLRMEVARFGVKVILVEPGGFGTGIWDSGAESFPDDEDSAYADVYGHAKTWTRRGNSFFDPVWVARVIRLALGTSRPLPRYLVGFDAVGLTLSDLAPTAITDRVKRWSAKL